VSFIRPEARAALLRWAEPVLAGGLAVVAGLAAWRGLASGAVTGWLGLVAALAAAFWLRAAAGRALAARPAGEGPGMVEVREREIRHFGPLSGGIVALDALARIEVFVPGPGQPACWRLVAQDERVLLIPLDAKGAEALPDAFAALPGYSDLAAAAAMRRRAPGRHLVWRRAGAASGPAISAS
jgi:hypothetical protein